MRRPLPVLACIALALGLAASARAAPIVYASPADDGVNDGITSLTPAALPVTLYLYLDPGETALEYVVGFEALSGLGLQSFTADDPNATVNFDAGAGTLALTGSLGAGRSRPIRIGALTLIGASPGGALRLADLPNAAAPALTNAAFGLTLIPVPQTVALVVPEPAARWLLPAMLALTRALRRRRD